MISLDKMLPSIQSEDNGNGPSQPNERVRSSAVVVPVHQMAGLPASELEPRKRRSLKPPKPMRSRQLYNGFTASYAGTIYFDLPDDTTIRQVTFAVTCTSYSASDYIQPELSISSSGSQTTNDAQGLLAVAAFECVGGGSPANVMLAAPVVTIPINWKGRKGDRIYLNSTESGSGTWVIRALVWFD